jgi:hypothetical protein
MGADVYQIEVVGFATAIPGYSDQWHRNLANRLKTLSATLGIPLEFPCEFIPYPASYGERAAQRLSFDEWNHIRGWIGHQHVPENDHGDPGDISRTIAFIYESHEEDEVAQSLIQPADPNHPLFGSWWLAEGLNKSWVPDGDTYATLRYIGVKAADDGSPIKLPTPWFDMLFPLVVNEDPRMQEYAKHPRYARAQQTTTVVNNTTTVDPAAIAAQVDALIDDEAILAAIANVTGQSPAGIDPAVIRAALKQALKEGTG